MEEHDVEYHEAPANGNGIISGKTTRQVRCWGIPRTFSALEKLNNKLGKGDYPGNYILFEGKNKAYVGEAKNIYKRLKEHMNNPEDKIKKWDRALIFNDGRTAILSEFNDTVVRKSLEYYLINLFKINKFKVVNSQDEFQNRNSLQDLAFNSFRDEITIVLFRKRLILKLFEKTGQEEIHKDKLRKLIISSGKQIQELGAKEAVIDGQKVFIRPGSDKKKGWQITFRDLSKSALQSGDGYLLVPRGPILLIPMTEIQKAIGGEKEYNKSTVDIFILFEEDAITLKYKQNTLDITNFKL